jgi:hypothetical protein
MRASILGMDSRSQIRISTLCFAPRSNLGQDFISVGAGVKGATFREQLDDMKPSNAPNQSQREFRRLNRVTLEIGRGFSRSKPDTFMVNAEISP